MADFGEEGTPLGPKGVATVSGAASREVVPETPGAVIGAVVAMGCLRSGAVIAVGAGTGTLAPIGRSKSPETPPASIHFVESARRTRSEVLSFAWETNRFNSANMSGPIFWFSRARYQ